MQKEQCEPVSNPFARSMCNDPRSQSSPCLSNSGTETARSYGEEEHNQPIKFPWADSAHSVLSFITSWNNACWLQSSSTSSTSTSSEEGRQSVEPSLRGEGTAGRASEPRERALDLMGKEEDKDSPVFVPTWSICDSNERSQRSALFSAKRAGTVKNAGEGSYQERLRERARSVPFYFYTGSQLPRELTPLALLSSRQHTDCVYLQQRKLFVCREEHTACNAIRTRQVLVLLYTYSYRGAHPECLWDTANRNKLQQISTDTHRAVAEWQKLTPVPPHVLLCCLADYVTCLWRLAHLLDSFHMCSEHGYAGGVP